MTSAVFLFSLTSSLALATRTPENIAQFASRHDVQVRQVTRKVGNRRIRRIFVPLLADSTAMSRDFVKTFLTDDRMLLFARPSMSQTYPYDYYVRAAFKSENVRRKTEIWASAYDVCPRVSIKNTPSALIPQVGSRTVVLNIGQSAVQNARAFLPRFHKSASYGKNKQTMEQLGHALWCLHQPPDDTVVGQTLQHTALARSALVKGCIVLYIVGHRPGCC